MEIKSYNPGDEIFVDGKKIVVPDWCSILETKEYKDVPSAKISLYDKHGTLIYCVGNLEANSRKELEQLLDYAYNCLMNFFETDLSTNYKIEMVINYNPIKK